MPGRRTSACSDECRAAKSRRNPLPLPRAEAQAVRARLTAALEAIGEAKAAWEESGGE